MALGLYHDNFTVEEAERGILTGEWATVERVLPFEIEKICAAKQISRNRFIKSLAFPQPTTIQNLTFCAELRKRFGHITAPGFVDGKFVLSKGYGLYIPRKSQGEIVELKFYPMKELLKPAKLTAPTAAA